MTKSELLEKYAGKQPKEFRQYDVNAEGPLTLAENSPDGVITWGKTWELMEGSDLRVLIPPGQQAEEVVSNLRALAHCIAKNGFGDHSNEETFARIREIMAQWDEDEKRELGPVQ